MSISTQLAEQTSSRVRTGIEARALELLGQNIPAAQVAMALGVTESLISQYMADPTFLGEVAELRFKTLAKHNTRDLAYDEMEDALLSQLKSYLPFVVDPMKIARLIQVINGAKRRGSTAPESLIAKSEVISLTLPIQIVNQFQVNSANQVVKAGEQDLVTVQSGRMQELLSHTSTPLLPSPTNQPTQKDLSHVSSSNSPAT